VNDAAVQIAATRTTPSSFAHVKWEEMLLPLQASFSAGLEMMELKLKLKLPKVPLQVVISRLLVMMFVLWLEPRMVVLAMVPWSEWVLGGFMLVT
jgi:hypothetical protein